MFKKITKLLKDLVIVQCLVFLCGMICRFILFPLIFRVDGNAFYFKVLGLSLIWGAVITILLLTAGLFLFKKSGKIAWISVIPLGLAAIVTAAEAFYLYNGKFYSTTDFLPFLLRGMISVADIGWPVLQYAPFIIGTGIIALALWYEGRE